jgi:hypothetical protein
MTTPKLSYLFLSLILLCLWAVVVRWVFSLVR